MLKLASIYTNVATKAYSGAKNVGKAFLTKEDPVTKARRFSAKKTAITGAGLYLGKKLLDEGKRQSDNLSRNYMDDIHPYRQSDTLRVAR
jgi:hypothetical protein